MAIKKKLILVSHEEIEFTDKKTGEQVKKHKYLFMKPDGTYMPPQFDENGLYAGDVQIIENGWDESKAKDFPFDLREFNGVVTEKLATGQKRFSDNVRKK